MEKQDLKKKILSNIQEHVESWKQVKEIESIKLDRMSELSNPVFRVKIEDEELDQKVKPSTLLYRVFENDIVDWKVENAIFKVFSD